MLVLFKTAIFKPAFLGNIKLGDRFPGVLGIYHKLKNNFLWKLSCKPISSVIPLCKHDEYYVQLSRITATTD
jgi:hypothetical protein